MKDYFQSSLHQLEQALPRIMLKRNRLKYFNYRDLKRLNHLDKSAHVKTVAYLVITSYHVLLLAFTATICCFSHISHLLTAEILVCQKEKN